MKKIICIILILFQLFGLTSFAADMQVSEAMKNDLFHFGIMVGDGNGNLRLKDDITRAEFCKMVCVALGFQNTRSDLLIIEDFYDLDKNHWAYYYIQTARGLSLIEGVENGCFQPNENVTLLDAIKTIVCALGYRPKAEEGGYPEGYINVSRDIGLLQNIGIQWEQPATREDAAYLIATCLDIPLLQQISFGAEPQYSVMDGNNGVPLITLRSILKSES